MNQLTAPRMAKHWFEPGFALIEMIGVIAIMAVLAGAMAPFLLNQLDNSEADAEQLALDAIAEGIGAFYLDQNAATYGSLPPNLNVLAGNYVGASAADLTVNDRDVNRLYVSNGANLSTIPQASVVSHLLLGGAAPTALAAGCIGSAQVAADPCGDSPGTTTDDMPAGISNGLIKVVNLNLAEARAEIIATEKRRFLTPAAEAFRSLPNDVCQGIATNTDFTAPTNLNAIAEITAANPNIQTVDSWGTQVRVNKFVDRIVVWSEGPTAVAAIDPPINPLFVTTSCESGSDVNEQLEQIADSVVGTMLAQIPGPISLPATLAAAGVSAADDDDPWGNNINFVVGRNNYSNGGVITAETDSFVIWSNGPDGVNNSTGGDDVWLNRRADEIKGIFGAMGRTYVTSEPTSPDPGVYDCTASAAPQTVDNWMTGAGGCDTALGYLINASNCNQAIAYDQECTVAGY